MGCENWPNTKEYKQCPICGEPTKLTMGNAATPLSEEDARSIRLHAEFDEFYETQWTPNEDELDPDLLERIEAWPERFEKPKFRPSKAEISQNARISGIKPRGSTAASHMP
jgi:hypothetical protein